MGLVFAPLQLSLNPSYTESWTFHDHCAFVILKSMFFFKKNGPTPASFSFIFGLFKQTLQFLQYVKGT